LPYIQATPDRGEHHEPPTKESDGCVRGGRNKGKIGEKNPSEKVIRKIDRGSFLIILALLNSRYRRVEKSGGSGGGVGRDVIHLGVCSRVVV